jgi:hypothetical protein
VETLEEILQRQDRWARGRGFSPNEQGHLPIISENLFISLSAATVAELERGAGRELHDRSGEPAKMLAVHSSAALVCNVFEYWRQTDLAVIGQVLGIPDPIVSVHVEKPVHTGLRGTALTLDLLLVGKKTLRGASSHYSRNRTRVRHRCTP